MLVFNPRRRRQATTYAFVCALLANSAASAMLVLSIHPMQSEPAAQPASAQSAANKTQIATTAAPAAQITLNAQQARYLVRSTFKSLYDATQTGNFTVLRDLATEDFRNRYSAAQLSERFSQFASAAALASTVTQQPELTGAQPLDGGKGISLSGTLGADPGQNKFSIVFAPVLGRWLLMDLNIALASEQRLQQPAATGTVHIAGKG